jgi:hypothetical protein
MKNKILITISSILGFLGIVQSASATSTVMLDPPNISELIGGIWTVAQPIYNSVSGWLPIIIGVPLVFGLIALIVKSFRDKI